jgi:hypothetical protein
MKIAITLDTDSLNQNNSKWEIQKLDFNYMNELKAFYEMAKRHGLPVTTFVRIDEQVAHNMGDGLYIYNTVKKLAEDSGVRHEFGWHPHLFKLDEKARIWSQLKEEDEMLVQLARTYEKYESVIRPMKGVRVGAAQSGPRVLKLLMTLGFQYDSSCLAGCKHQDENRWFDWEPSPNTVFYPAQVDYRQAGTPSARIGIKEIPITTMSTIANYDSNAKRRAINPAYHHYIFKNGIDNFWASALNQKLLVVAFHGDELNRYHEDNLFNYGLSNFWLNLTYMEKSLFDRKIAHSFHLMSEL